MVPHGDLDGWMTATATTSLVVRRGGEVVLDRCHAPAGPGWYGLDGTAHEGAPDGAIGLPFAPTAGGRVAHDVASAQKSVVALLCASAIERGLLALDDPVTGHLGEGWSRAGAAQEGAITVRHLMTMTSGLSDSLEVEAAPGTCWRYSLGPAWHLCKPVVAAASGRSLEALTREWLTGPLGLGDTEWISRPGMSYLDGTPFEALSTTAADLAAIGELVLRRGSWQGNRVIAAERIDELLRPSQELNPAYGLLWWLNGRRPMLLPMVDEPIDSVLLPSGPDDAVCALGAMGQVCAVSSSRDVVIVRLGGAAGGGLAALVGGSIADDLWRVLPSELVGGAAA